MCYSRLRDGDLLLSFCLKGGSGCEDILSEIALLDKIFKVLTERPALRSLVSFSVMEGTIVLRSRASRVVCFFASRFFTQA